METINEKANLIIKAIEKKINDGKKIISIKSYSSICNGVTKYQYCLDTINEEFDNYRDMEKIYDLVSNYFKNKKDKNKIYIVNSITISKSLYSNYNILSNIEVIKPCKEFAKLNNYLTKYADKTIDVKKFFRVETCGKRGVYYDTNDKTFYAEDSELCSNVLEWLRKHRATNDIINVQQYHYKNESDRDYSIRYETECYGIRKETYKIEIFTPKNKLKASLIISLCL